MISNFFISTQIVARIIMIILLLHTLVFTFLRTDIDEKYKNDVYSGLIVISLLMWWGGLFR
jgi:hypothetical protein